MANSRNLSISILNYLLLRRPMLDDQSSCGAMLSVSLSALDGGSRKEALPDDVDILIFKGLEFKILRLHFI
jgi:hypothetical protein